MLDLLCRVSVASMRTKALHPDSRYTIQKNDQRLDELCGGYIALRAIPSPAQLGEGNEQAQPQIA